MTNIPKIIDLSAWQQNVDYVQVIESGVEAVILRVSRGHYYGDIAYAHHRTQFRKRGVRVGGYHYFYPNRDPIWQADVFVSNWRYCHIPPILDLEETRGQPGWTIANRAMLWLEAVELRTGYKPWIYTRARWFNDHVGPWFPAKGEYPLMIAHYTNAAKPTIPKGWDDYDLWQYAKNVEIPGINGGVDACRVNPENPYTYLFRKRKASGKARYR